MKILFRRLSLFLLILSLMFIGYKTIFYETLPPLVTVISELIVLIFSLICLVCNVPDDFNDSTVTLQRIQAFIVILFFGHLTQLILLDELTIGWLPMNSFIQLAIWGSWFILLFTAKKYSIVLNPSVIGSDSKTFRRHLWKIMKQIGFLFAGLLAYLLIIYPTIHPVRELYVTLIILSLSMGTFVFQYIFFSYIFRFIYLEKGESQAHTERLISRIVVLLLVLPLMLSMIYSPLHHGISYLSLNYQELYPQWIKTINQLRIYLLLTEYDLIILKLIGLGLLFKGLRVHFPSSSFKYQCLWIVSLFVFIGSFISLTITLFAPVLSFFFEFETFSNFMKMLSIVSFLITLTSIGVQLVIFIDFYSKGYSFSLYLLYQSLLSIITFLFRETLNVTRIGIAMVPISFVINLLSFIFFLRFYLQGVKTVHSVSSPPIIQSKPIPC